MVNLEFNEEGAESTLNGRKRGHSQPARAVKGDLITLHWLTEETWSTLDGLKRGHNQPSMALKGHIVNP